MPLKPSCLHGEEHAGMISGLKRTSTTLYEPSVLGENRRVETRHALQCPSQLIVLREHEGIITRL